MTIEGATSYEDVKAYMDLVVKEPKFRPGMPAIVDCRRVKSLFSISDLRKTAADARARPEMKVRGRVAVLASSNLIYGLLRMYEVFSEGTPNEMRVFRQPEEAFAWLKSREEAGE
ncbi:MAG TPA: hypothetical protein VHJ20_20775 [Polyangia bacterium]|nr:hypothetical protein [Polyangia bacterium]